MTILIAQETLTQWTLSLAEMQKAQLLMVAGFVMLGWVLIRRQMGMKKRVNRDAKAANKALRAMRDRTEPAVPLCDAPVETQRWQVALFDLQRELKAELDTRISVVQSLMRQLDDRIERCSELECHLPGHSADEIPLSRHGLSAQQFQWVSELAQAGHTSAEIAQQTGLAIGDVELILGTINLP